VQGLRLVVVALQVSQWVDRQWWLKQGSRRFGLVWSGIDQSVG
jgi:hypothetical protein